MLSEDRWRDLFLGGFTTVVNIHNYGWKIRFVVEGAGGCEYPVVAAYDGLFLWDDGRGYYTTLALYRHAENDKKVGSILRPCNPHQWISFAIPRP